MISNMIMPSLFLSHGGGPGFVIDFSGSPFHAIDQSSQVAQFMRGLRKYVGDETVISKVRAILVITAHWEENTITLDYPSNEKCSLIYDYYGFPKEAYEPYLVYPAQTDHKIADRIADLLSNANIPCDKKSRGLDHGTFIPLLTAFPEANIPVIQLSLKSGLDMEYHIKLGEAIAPLRKEGILIIGSGQITHNLSAMRRSATETSIDPRAIEFTEWINNFLQLTNFNNYESQKKLFIDVAKNAPHFNWFHPRTEHFVPLAVIFGTFLLQNGKEYPSSDSSIKRIYKEIVLNNMGLDSYIVK